MIKIEIKNRWTGKILFEYSKEDNTMKDTVLEAIKSGADLRDADLSRADLRDADLSYSNLSTADLSGADLRGADLCGADLSSEDLSYANLRGADLSYANLRGADLRGADLSSADLSGAIIDYNDEDEYRCYQAIIDTLEKNSNLCNIEIYVNHDSFSSTQGVFWKNLLIIRKWQIKK